MDKELDFTVGYYQWKKAKKSVEKEDTKKK